MYAATSALVAKALRRFSAPFRIAPTHASSYTPMSCMAKDREIYRYYTHRCIDIERYIDITHKYV